MKFDSPITIDSGVSAPIFVNASPSTLCAGLNVEFLGGYRANQFALSNHTHAAGDVTSGTFDPARLGSSFGPSDNRKVLMNNGTIGQWRQLSASEISGISGVSVTMLGKATTGEIRDYIGAAPASHTHDASAVVSGLFSVNRLGSGVSGTSYVLVGNSNLSAGGQWKQLTYADISSAAGFSASTTGRIPVWAETGVLGNSPFVVGGSSITADADLGVTGTMTCADVNIGGQLIASYVYNRDKTIIQGSGSVVVSPNDGLQTLTLTSVGGPVFGSANKTDVDDSTTTETTLIASIRSGESKTIPSGALTAGAMIHIVASGTYTTVGASGWSNNVLRVKVGGVVLSYTTTDDDGYEPNGWRWELDAWLTVVTPGSNAAYVAKGRIAVRQPFSSDEYPTMGFRPLFIELASNSGTLNTTGGVAVDVTWHNAQTNMEMDVTCNHALVTLT